MTSWSAAELAAIDAAAELHIAVRRGDGSARPPLPIWAVTAGGQVYVRTWHRRDTGWFGRVLRSRRARITVPGLDADVGVEDVGARDERLRAAVDDAYRAKYGTDGGAARMIGDEAAAATLRLDREAPGPGAATR